MNIGGLEVREVRLAGGPSDGQLTLASHWTAVVSGRVYIWDGGPDKDRFVPVEEVIGEWSAEKRSEIEERLQKCLRNQQAVDHEVSAWIEWKRYSGQPSEI